MYHAGDIVTTPDGTARVITSAVPGKTYCQLPDHCEPVEYRDADLQLVESVFDEEAA